MCFPVKTLAHALLLIFVESSLGFIGGNMKNLKSGFSLVELMIVVAIIGILATIAVPNFTKFQAKAKQTNAKTELAGIYTAEKSFYSEYSSYNANLNHIGYIPDG